MANGDCCSQYVLVQRAQAFCNAFPDCNTGNPDLPPPWQGLHTPATMTQLLNPACVPSDPETTFGYNLAHCSKASTKALIEHWMDVGFLEFRKVWRNGKLQEPVPVEERWHMLRDDEDVTGDPDVRLDEDDGITTDEAVLTFKPPMYGSKGPLLLLDIGEAAGFTDPIHDDTLPLFDDVETPPPLSTPTYDPSNPIWTPPCVVPNSSWCRGQYVLQSSREVRGAEMQAIQRASFALVQCNVCPFCSYKV